MTRLRSSFAALMLMLSFFGQLNAEDYLVEQEMKLNAATNSGNYTLAKKIILEMLAAADSTYRNDPESRSYVYSDASSIYVDLEDFETAVNLAQKSIDEGRRVWGENDSRFALPFNNLGNACLFLGRLKESEVAHRRALELRLVEYGPDSDEYSDSLDNLGSAVDKMGRYAESRPLYEQSLKVRIQLHGTNDHRVARTLSNIGDSLVWQGRLEDAENYFTNAMSIYDKTLPPKHPSLITPLDHLAHICLKTGRLAEAEKSFQRAIAISNAAYGKDGRYSDLDGGMATLYEVVGQYDKAAKLYQKRIEYFKRTKSSPLQMMDAMVWLGSIYSVQRKMDEADKLLDEASRLSEDNEATPLQRFAIYYARALNQMARSQFDDALASFKEAIKFAEAERVNLEGSFVNHAETFARTRVAYDVAGLLTLDKGDLPSAFDFFERGRARSFLDQMAASHVDPLEGLPAEQRAALRADVVSAEHRIKQIEKEFDDALKKYDSQTEDGKKVLEPLRGRLATARHKLVTAHAAIANASPVYRKVLQRDVKTTRYAEMQEWATKSETIVIYYVVTWAGTALVYFDPIEKNAGFFELNLSKEQAETLKVDPGPLTLLKSTTIMLSDGKGIVDVMKNRRRTPEEWEGLVKRLAALREILIPDKLLSSITSGNAKQLVISPTGGLCYFPFETLVTNQQGTDVVEYLLDKCPPTAYTPSISVLFKLMEAGKAGSGDSTPSVLTLGDPLYEKPGIPGVQLDRGTKRNLSRLGPRPSPLPGTGHESRAVVAAFQKQGIKVGQLLQSTATEASLRQNAPGRTILHLACHGSASNSYGNFYGGLSIAEGPNAATDPADDGELTVAEIYPLDLRRCELAILSACQTNIGPNETGEGVWGISRAFQVAGAKRVVASFWSVDDLATAALMTDFCQSLAEQTSRKSITYADSLHQAKRNLRKNSSTSDPFLWAPFVLVGPF